MILLLCLFLLAGIFDDVAVSKEISLLVVAVIVETLRELRSFIYRRKIRRIEKKVTSGGDAAAARFPRPPTSK